MQARFLLPLMCLVFAGAITTTAVHAAPKIAIKHVDIVADEDCCIFAFRVTVPEVLRKNLDKLAITIALSVKGNVEESATLGPMDIPKGSRGTLFLYPLAFLYVRETISQDTRPTIIIQSATANIDGKHIDLLTEQWIEIDNLPASTLLPIMLAK